MYKFRRLDDDRIIEVDFAYMMENQINGLLAITENGETVYARRVSDGPQPKKTQKIKEHLGPIVSDSLGFPTRQLADFERDRIVHGFHDIEFKPDPISPGVCQAHIGSQSSLKRYLKHRGMMDRNSRNGSAAGITERDLELGKKRILEANPDTKPPMVVKKNPEFSK